MDQFELDEILEIKENVADILELEDDYLKQKMLENPDELLQTMKAGFLILYKILDEVTKDNE